MERSAGCRMFVLLWLPTVVCGASQKDYDALVRGRGVLLQFVVPGPAANDTRSKWHALAEEYGRSEEVYVGRIFCDGATGEALCADLLSGRLVGAFPSVFYGDPYELSEYLGDKSLGALVDLAKSVRAPCSLERRDRCDAKRLKLLESLEAMPPSALDEALATTGFSQGGARGLHCHFSLNLNFSRGEMTFRKLSPTDDQ